MVMLVDICFMMLFEDVFYNCLSFDDVCFTTSSFLMVLTPLLIAVYVNGGDSM